MTARAFSAKPFRMIVGWLWSDGFSPEELRYGAIISVWVRWFWVIGALIEINYPAGYQDRYYVLNTLYVLTPGLINGYVYYRIRAGNVVSARWLLALSALDVFVTSFSVAMSGGFESHFYPVYLLVLAMFAVVFTSVRLTVVWTTLVAVIYGTLSWTVGAGLDLAANDEKDLVTRILMMYGVACAVSLIARYERIQRREAVAREQRSQRERIQLSQMIHDTVGQSAYMIGIGIDNAKELSAWTNPELVRSLEATGKLARSAMWSLRHPIDIGVIFDGQGLGTTLSSHAATFTAITSIPAEVTQLGTEPPLAVATKSMLFSIAHNAMTNVFRHAEANRVEIILDFESDRLGLSISDDGKGLPEDYERRGHGFRNMRTDAERLGGELYVKDNAGGVGTTVMCLIPFERVQGGL